MALRIGGTTAMVVWNYLYWVSSWWDVDIYLHVIVQTVLLLLLHYLRRRHRPPPIRILSQDEYPMVPWQQGICNLL